MAQLGCFDLAQKTPPAWLSNTSPQGSDAVVHAFPALLEAFWTTWTNGNNVYGKQGRQHLRQPVR